MVNTRRRRDRRMFRKTAVRTKRVNISPVIYRGGIRL
ncbi:DNA binding protein [Dipodfec virus UOA04_Rod_815]|nr:DNA binding protein [Dipodfec virus UOA04_Rod_815]